MSNPFHEKPNLLIKYLDSINPIAENLNNFTHPISFHLLTQDPFRSLETMQAQEEAQQGPKERREDQDQGPQEE